MWPRSRDALRVFLLLTLVLLSGCGQALRSPPAGGTVIVTNEGSETRTVRIAASAIEGGEDRTTTVTVASGGEERVDLLPETGEYRIEATVTDGPGQDELTRSVDGSVVTVAVGPEGLDLTEGSP